MLRRAFKLKRDLNPVFLNNFFCSCPALFEVVNFGQRYKCSAEQGNVWDRRYEAEHLQ